MTAEHNLSSVSPSQTQAPSPISEIKCPECDGTGNAAHGTGMLRFCECPEGRAYMGFTHRFNRLWDNAGIPQRFVDARLDREYVSPEVYRRLENPYRRFTQYEDSEDGFEQFYSNEKVFEWRGSYLFWGSYGVGKTCTAVGLAHEVLMGMYDYRDVDYDSEAMGFKFATLPDLLSELRDTYNQRGLSEGEVLRKYQSPWLLVLDDLGAEHVKDMDWLRDRLFQLIGHRHAEERPTIFTSNLSPEELGGRLGERVMWRLVEMCGADHIIHLNGPNLRAR